MSTITLSVPNELKLEMDKTDFINWSSVARRAFTEILRDVKKLELFKKVREISEISEDDKREVKESVVKGLIADVEKLKSDSKSLKEFNDWCDK